MMMRASGTVTFRWPSGTPYDAGAACLDFAYSGGIGAYAAFETLHVPNDLARWLAGPPVSVLVAPPSTDDLAKAVEVREAIRDLLTAAAGGASPPPAAARITNRAAALPPLAPQLRAGAVGWAPGATVEQALSTLARDALDVLALGLRVAQCSADDCPLIFIDDSRNSSRRWCSMQRCGNRAKVRRHRAADPSARS